MNITTKTTAFLLVEGNDDRNVFSELRDQHHIPREQFAIKVAGSKSQLDQLFVEEIQTDDGKIIGVVRDADENPLTSWQSLKDRIERLQLGYYVPENLPQTGIIIEPPNENLPRLGIWLMPNNQSGGELEDFVRACIIDESDPLIPYANKILDEIETAKVHRYRNKRSKAFVYTWLAWQREPGIDIRKNFKQGVLSANSPIAETFVNWLNQLFNS